MQKWHRFDAVVVEQDGEVSLLFAAKHEEHRCSLFVGCR